MQTRYVVGLIALVAGVLFAACGGSDGPAGSATPRSSAEGTGYALEFRSRNFVLPQRGGIDAANLTIGGRGEATFGELERTGDGRYQVVYVGGETFFRRETCDHFARIPGGGPDVLQPLVSAPAAALKAMGKLIPVPGVSEGQEIEGLGTGDIDVDSGGILTRITGLTDAGEAFEISFSWGVGATILKPEGVTGDQGPGGNPC